MGLIHFENWEPGYVSHSTISGYNMCPKKTFFAKVLCLEEKPGLAAIGGNAVHSATQRIDEAAFEQLRRDNGAGR